MYPQEMNIEHCRSCNAAIFFGITAKGKSMPIDAEPNYIDGNVLLVWQDGMVAMSDGLPCVRVASKANPAPEGATVTPRTFSPARTPLFTGGVDERREGRGRD